MRPMSYRSSKVMGACIPSCPNSSHSRRAGGRAFSILIRGGIHICEVLERADGKMQPLFDGPSDVKATNVGVFRGSLDRGLVTSVIVRALIVGWTLQQSLHRHGAFRSRNVGLQSSCLVFPVMHGVCVQREKGDSDGSGQRYGSARHQCPVRHWTQMCDVSKAGDVEATARYAGEGLRQTGLCAQQRGHRGPDELDRRLR